MGKRRSWWRKFRRQCMKVARDPYSSWRIIVDDFVFKPRRMREDDVPAVAAIEDELYGTEEKDRVTEDGLRSWLRVHRHSAYVIEHGGKILGALGLWPLRKEAYLQLTGGKLTEDKLCADDLAPGVGPETAAHLYWYLGALEAAPRFNTRTQRGAIAAKLIRKVFADWVAWAAKEIDDRKSLHIAAVGYTERGRCMLHSFGFTQASPGDNGHDIFEKVGIEDMRRMSTAHSLVAETDGHLWKKSLAWRLFHKVCGVLWYLVPWAGRIMRMSREET